MRRWTAKSQRPNNRLEAELREMIGRLDKQPVFPDPNRADASGLVAVGGDLSIPRLLAAYRAGVFPWTVDPITWWSPDPRTILEINNFHIPRSLLRTLKTSPFHVTFDQNFAGVISGCAAAPRAEGETWISGAFQSAYQALHQAGHAHSVEVWNGTDLVGGVYGVSIGGFFAGESMFHRQSNASKVGLVRLLQHLAGRGFLLFDTQMTTAVTAALGAVEIPRQVYLARLSVATAAPVSFAG